MSTQSRAATAEKEVKLQDRRNAICHYMCESSYVIPHNFGAHQVRGRRIQVDHFRCVTTIVIAATAADAPSAAKIQAPALLQRTLAVSVN